MSTSPSIDFSDAAIPDNSAWKSEVSARVQAHRTRRQSGQSSLPGMEPVTRRGSERTAVVADAVARRYATTLSYSDYLARLEHAEQNAPRDLERDEEALALPLSSQVALLDEHDVDLLDLASQPEVDAIIAPTAPRATIAALRGTPVFPAALTPSFPAAIQAATQPAEEKRPRPDSFLDEVTVEPDAVITSKLIHFPRQLIAARRARPRLAEGPLREEALASPDPRLVTSQLRIFEVEEEQISRTPAAPSAHTGAAAAAEWHYIQLDTPLLSTPLAATADEPHMQEHVRAHLQVAPMGRRMMAAAVDFGLVTVGFLIFAAGFIAMESHPPSDTFALLSAVAVYVALLAGYQWLFFSLSDATPGMRYARIALCTFKDDNPTVRARRWRIGATFLSAAVAGLGFAWMWLDHDSLGWHDRISRTYQRCY